MRVRRSEVKDRVSIHRESVETGANAMSSSRLGRVSTAAALRTKRSAAGPAGTPGIIGSHRVAGASEGSRATFLGPVRRSIVEASDFRQLPAACARSAGVISDRTSLSASANVAALTSGPTGGAVPNAGGVPATGVTCGAGGATWASAAVRLAAATPTTPAAARARNSLRDSDMASHLERNPNEASPQTDEGKVTPGRFWLNSTGLTT